MAQSPGRHRWPPRAEASEDAARPLWAWITRPWRAWITRPLRVWITRPWRLPVTKRTTLVVAAAVLLVAGCAAALFGPSEEQPLGVWGDAPYPFAGPSSSAEATAAVEPTDGASSAPPQTSGAPRTPAGPETDRRYDSCAQVIAAGLGPYKAGRDPEYAWYPDDDRDGWVCERAPEKPGRVRYRTCAEAYAAGVTPLHRGDPGYDRRLDRDGDGVACD